MDINKIINEKLAEMEENGAIEKAIADNIEKTVINAVNSVMNSYGLQRSIEDKLRDEVNTIVAKVGFTAYNSYITDVIEKLLKEQAREDVKDKLTKCFEKAFKQKYECFKLSDIAKAYKEMIDGLDIDERHEMSNGHFYVSITHENSGSFDYTRILFALKSNPLDYSDYTLRINCMKYKDEPDTITSMLYQGDDIANLINAKHFGELECLLANLYMNRTPIILDVDEDDIDTSIEGFEDL